jgi:hypothetical protein
MKFKRDHSQVRQATCKLIEMMDDGILDPKVVAEAALSWMSDDDVERFANAYEFFYDDEEDEDEE